MEKVVYVVHAIDTEGPLYESTAATFERINELIGRRLEPSRQTLERIWNGELDLGGEEDLIRDIFSRDRVDTHGTWDQIDRMLDDITSEDFRTQVPDSIGGGWTYSWFCLDHVGYSGLNPRRRDIGYHNVQDHYTEYFRAREDENDLIQWHYHALSITNDAHRAGSTYLNSNHIHNILTRKVIERSWFPAAFRPGHHTERPDSHFFLEQWIPFDFGNDAAASASADLEVSPARYGDWRRAPRSWIPYHPSHDDHQVPGNCRRLIARCLPIAERGYQISREDVVQAFEEASQRGASLLAVTNHDFRDMRPDVEKVMRLLKECAAEASDVQFRYVNAIEAVRQTMELHDRQCPGLKAELNDYKTHTRLVVEADHLLFGPQPYLAIRTGGGEYYWQSFDFEGEGSWSYSFDANNIELPGVSDIGVAANTRSGVTEIVNIDVETRNSRVTVLNR